MRNRAGIIQRFPMGTDEVDIAMLRRPKAGWDVVWDAAGTVGGDIPAFTLAGVRNKEEFNRADFSLMSSGLFLLSLFSFNPRNNYYFEEFPAPGRDFKSS
jgi:hypothetical protein